MDDACVRGFVDDGTPRGREEVVGGCASYVARAASTPPRKALVICTDIFGPGLTNVRLIADRIAEDARVLVVVPDLFDGDAVPVSFMQNRFDLTPWMQRHGDDATLPHLRAVATELRAQGIERIAVQGYCWGGRYAILAGGADHRIADLVVACHPSRVAVPKDIEAIATPALFVCADNDRLFSPEVVADTERILATNQRPHLVKVYPKTEHGFAVRGDPKDPHVNAMRSEAIHDAVQFLKAHL